MAKLRYVTSMLIFGTIGIFVKYIPYPSSVIALIRGLIGVLFLLTAMFVIRHKLSRKAIKRNGLLLFLSGAAIGVNWICLFEAYHYTTVSVATLCYYMAPIFIILLSPIVLKERMTWIKMSCVLLALIGIGLVSGLSEGLSLYSDGKGVLFGISAAILYCSVVLMNKFIKEIAPIEATAVQLGVAALVILPYTLLTQDITVLHFTWKICTLLLFVGIINTGLAYLLYFTSIPQLNAQTVAIYSYVDPILAILLSALILHEHITGYQLLGAVLILGAALISDLSNLRKGASLA